MYSVVPVPVGLAMFQICSSTDCKRSCSYSWFRICDAEFVQYLFTHAINARWSGVPEKDLGHFGFLRWVFCPLCRCFRVSGVPEKDLGHFGFLRWVFCPH